MEKNGLERDAGFPVIEVRTGNGSWDGVERRKPRAVIGIPYSSGADRRKAADGEEIAVKTGAGNALLIGVVAAVAVVLSVCAAS